MAHLAQLPRTYLHMFRPTGPLNTLPSFQDSQGNKSSLPALQGNAEHCRHPFSAGGRHRSHEHGSKMRNVSRHRNGKSHPSNSNAAPGVGQSLSTVRGLLLQSSLSATILFWRLKETWRSVDAPQPLLESKPWQCLIY